MADISPVRQTIPLPSAQFLSAVSENLAQSIGGLDNFLAYFAYDTKRFRFNGHYSSAAMPQQFVDGMEVFEFNATILDVWLTVEDAGTAGTTQCDVLINTDYANPSGGTWTSIFTTTPQISYLAGSNVWVGGVTPSIVGNAYTPSPSYAAPVNTTPPVLNQSLTTLVPAWTAIRCDILQSQTGAKNAGLLVHFRPA